MQARSNTSGAITIHANAIIHSAIARKNRKYENACMHFRCREQVRRKRMKFNVFYKHVTALIKARQMLRHHTDVTVIVATTTKDDSWMQINMKSHRLQSEIFTISIENCRGVALSHCYSIVSLL